MPNKNLEQPAEENKPFEDHTIGQWPIEQEEIDESIEIPPSTNPKIQKILERINQRSQLDEPPPPILDYSELLEEKDEIIEEIVSNPKLNQSSKAILLRIILRYSLQDGLELVERLDLPQDLLISAFFTDPGFSKKHSKVYNDFLDLIRIKYGSRFSDVLQFIDSKKSNFQRDPEFDIAEVVERKTLLEKIEKHYAEYLRRRKLEMPPHPDKRSSGIINGLHLLKDKLTMDEPHYYTEAMVNIIWEYLEENHQEELIEIIKEKLGEDVNSMQLLIKFSEGEFDIDTTSDDELLVLVRKFLRKDFKCTIFQKFFAKANKGQNIGLFYMLDRDDSISESELKHSETIFRMYLGWRIKFSPEFCRQARYKVPFYRTQVHTSKRRLEKEIKEILEKSEKDPRDARMMLNKETGEYELQGTDQDKQKLIKKYQKSLEEVLPIYAEISETPEHSMHPDENININLARLALATGEKQEAIKYLEIATNQLEDSIRKEMVKPHSNSALIDIRFRDLIKVVKLYHSMGSEAALDILFSYRKEFLELKKIDQEYDPEVETIFCEVGDENQLEAVFYHTWDITYLRKLNQLKSKDIINKCGAFIEHSLFYFGKIKEGFLKSHNLVEMIQICIDNGYIFLQNTIENAFKKEKYLLAGLLAYHKRDIVNQDRAIKLLVQKADDDHSLSYDLITLVEITGLQKNLMKPIWERLKDDIEKDDPNKYSNNMYIDEEKDPRVAMTKCAIAITNSDKTFYTDMFMSIVEHGSNRNVEEFLKQTVKIYPAIPRYILELLRGEDIFNPRAIAIIIKHYPGFLDSVFDTWEERFKDNIDSDEYIDFYKQLKDASPKIFKKRMKQILEKIKPEYPNLRIKGSSWNIVKNHNFYTRIQLGFLCEDFESIQEDLAMLVKMIEFSKKNPEPLSEHLKRCIKTIAELTRELQESSPITPEIQDRIDLLNLLTSPEVKRDEIQQFQQKYEAPVVSREETLMQNQRFIDFVNAEYAYRPEEMLDYNVAVPSQNPKIDAERIYKLIFEEKEKKKKRKLWERFFGTRGKGESTEGDFSVSEGEVLKGGDPLDKDGKEVMKLSKHCDDFICKSVFGKIEENGFQYAARFPTHSKIPGRTRKIKVTLPIKKDMWGTFIQLPRNFHSEIDKESLKMNFEEDNKTKEILVQVPKRTKKIEYQLLVPKKPIVPGAITTKEYDEFHERFDEEYQKSAEALSESICHLPFEFRAFLKKIKKLSPIEKLLEIEKFLKQICYYDFNNKEVNEEKVGKSIDRQIEIMRTRMNSLKARFPSLRDKLKGKIFAGVCTDSALLSTILLREAGFLSSTTSGYHSSGKNVKTHEAHAISYIVWPDSDGYQLIPFDATPEGVTPGEKKELEIIRTPGIQKRIEEAERAKEEKLEESKERLEEMEEVETEKLTESSIRELAEAIISLGLSEYEFKLVSTLLNSRYMPLKDGSTIDIEKLNLDSKTGLRDLVNLLDFIEEELSRQKSEKFDPDKFVPGENMLELFDDFAKRYARNAKISERKGLEKLEKLIMYSSKILPEETVKKLIILIKYLRVEKE
ncbi:hypothetical protein ACFL21_03415 [Patescibacteria group bacterium]